MRSAITVLSAVASGMLVSGGSAWGQNTFVNWESPHVHPLDLTPDGATLLAVNTADNRLEVFSAAGGGLAHVASIPVGLDPVSVRARTSDGADEAWVVNHVSDSVSVVDLATLNVRATIKTGDEPTDVVFAGDPERAYVSVSQLNQVKVYDPANLAAAPQVIDVQGEDPRSLATDGTLVFALIFEAGNLTTILDESVVASSVNPYAGDPNPPPNSGTGFDPPIGNWLPNPPNVSIIVKKNDVGAWVDENGGDWSTAVGWGLHGHDVAVIDSSAGNAVSYANGFMSTNMALAVMPSGDVSVVGLDAQNHLRFEPNIKGTFAHVTGSIFTPPSGTPTRVDLNPHLTYATSTVPQNERDQSIGDPRGIGWNAAGDRAFIAGMGSNNLVVTDASLGRVGRVEVGEGPTGVVVDDGDGVVYVLNKFEASVSVVDADALTETGRIAFHDPTPPAIKTGRPHLYGTHETSGLGHLACASCHVDGRMDQLSWDLGDPQGDMKPFNQTCNFGLGGCEDWHPMKGPMTTQTLIGIIGTEPLHWRADREDLAAFNGAFEGLMGDDEQLTTQEMQEFEDFIATLEYPPNPYRTLAGTLSTTPINGGNAVTGSVLYTNVNLDGGALSCNDCHAIPTGTNGQLTSAPLIQESQSMKIPQLRNLYEKTGFDQSSSSNNRGFGFIHDGSVESLFTFLEFPGFNFAGGATGDQQRRDVTAFLFSFSTDTHAAVGVQATVGGALPDETALRDDLVALAGANLIGLVAKGVVNGEQRGYYSLASNLFISDRAAEAVTTAELDAAAGPGTEITYTAVPLGSQVRIGVDRDSDGALDRDEIDACKDPADATSFPGDGEPTICDCPGDIDGTGDVGFEDLLVVLANWGPCVGCPADVDSDGDVGFQDLLLVLSAWGPCE